MSKKLNGAELLQLIIDGKVKFGDKIERLDSNTVYTYAESCTISDNGTLWWGNIEVKSSQLLNGTFQLIEKPVSFIEAIKAYTNGKDIMCELDGGHIVYKNKFCEDNCVNILNDDYGNGISAEEILNGEWYID